MIAKTAEVTLYRAPFFQKIDETILFKNTTDRTTYFHEVGRIHGSQAFKNINFIRDEWRISLPINNFDLITQFNYARVYSVDTISGMKTEYFCFVGDYDYVTMTNVTVNLIPDPLVTWATGDTITNNARCVHILRQHFNKAQFKANIDYLRRNSDTLAVQTLDYVYQKANFFSLDYVVFHCSADLGQSFGNQQAPDFKYSKGNVVNNMASPLNNYVVSYGNWQKFTTLMSPYPWIMNQITNAMIIPQRLINLQKDFGKVTGKSVDYKGILWQPKNGIKPLSIALQGLTCSADELGDIFGCKRLEDLALMREPYCGIHLTNNAGQAIDLKPELLQHGQGEWAHLKRLEFRARTSYGYHNEMRVFPIGYNAYKENGVGHVATGTFLENSISFANFLPVPIAVDQRTLAVANQNASSRFNKLVSTTEVATKTAGDAGFGGGLVGAVSAVSKAAQSAIADKISQTITQFQLALSPDKKMLAQTVSDMDTTNALAVANEFFGCLCKFERINSTEFNKVKQYHGQFGYEYGLRGQPCPLDTMNICNYLQIKGNWTIKHVPHDQMVYLRQLLESGVTFWHWKPGDSLEPNTKRVEENKMIK
nr:MAG TPA: Major tail protein [Caudoviricetes sp.]